jgi:starch synthase
LYSLRYGTLPIVTRVGGLADTVTDADVEHLADGTANGFVLAEHSASALIETVGRVLQLYKHTDAWRRLQLTGMALDFSWQASARQYLALYQQALNR